MGDSTAPAPTGESAPTTGGRQVFVSYARVDLPRVAPLVQILETCGFRVWWDQALDVGGQW
ncbi:MAG TPA: toll/interleukin-1 receptor domain-containing protein, partial [Vicinamibacterales bacterium]|nr:toll/interleukin-1 receptor domain-containing protein [Vicinamibacterales bacterium]